MFLKANTLQLFRPKETESLGRFLDLVQACNDHSDTTRLRYVFDGGTFNDYTTTEGLKQAFADLQQQWNEGNFDRDVILSTDKEMPLLSLVHTDPFEYTSEDNASFNFHGGRPLLLPDGHFSYEGFYYFFTTAINAYKARYAAVYDTELETLVSFASFYGEVEIDQEVSMPEIIEVTPVHLTERIGKVMSPGLFNPLEIPPAIYWFNYWNDEQVQAVGEEKIRQADFEVIEKTPDGGYILIVQKENFNSHNIDHLEKLAALCDYFDLYTLQRTSA